MCICAFLVYILNMCVYTHTLMSVLFCSTLTCHIRAHIFLQPLCANKKEPWRNWES